MSGGLLNKLLLALPCGELGYSSFWRHLLDARSPHHKDFGYMAYTGRILTNEAGYLHTNHYALVQLALTIPGWERLLFMEHDHEFPEGFLRKHAAYDGPIVGGSYVLRDIEEPLPVFYRWDQARESVELYNAVEANEMLTHRGLYPVDVVPLGCTSIRRDVLEKWPENQPIFSSYTNRKGRTVSLDVWFCRIAQDEMGITPMVDTSLSVKHYAKVALDDSFFVKWWNQIGAPRAIKELEAEQAAAASA